MIETTLFLTLAQWFRNMFGKVPNPEFLGVQELVLRDYYRRGGVALVTPKAHPGLVQFVNSGTARVAAAVFGLTAPKRYSPFATPYRATRVCKAQRFDGVTLRVTIMERIKRKPLPHKRATLQMHGMVAA